MVVETYYIYFKNYFPLIQCSGPSLKPEDCGKPNFQ